MSKCDLCGHGFHDGVTIVDVVEGEYENDQGGGMAAHGGLKRYHRRCWEKIEKIVEKSKGLNR